MLVWPETSPFPWKHQGYTDLLNMFIYVNFSQVCVHQYLNTIYINSSRISASVVEVNHRLVTRNVHL